MHSLGIVQWDSTRRDHPGYPGRVSGTGLVMGRIYLNNMRREFHNLKQRQSSVTEYVREFTRLSKYAPDMLVSEEEKCLKFEDGLSDHIRAHVTRFCHDDFSKITACALNVERVKKEENERKDRRQGNKNPGQSSSCWAEKKNREIVYCLYNEA